MYKTVEVVEAPATRSSADVPETKGDHSFEGITLAAFHRAVDLAGGRGVVAGKSTAWLKYNVILPHTRAGKCSFSTEIAANSDPARSIRTCGRANVFISHAYDYMFLNVLDAVTAWEAQQPVASGPFFYYFDLFVVNQHGQDGVVPFEVLRDEFGGGVRGIGRTLLFLDWRHPVALRRCWCVFEIATSLDVGASFSVIMTPRDEASFEQELVCNWDSVVAKTCSVDAERAEAGEPADAFNIKRVVSEQRGGFLKVNQLIVGAMQDWMVSTGQKLLSRIADLHERNSSLLAASVAGLLHHQGKVDDALAMCTNVLAAYRKAFGDEHVYTIRMAITAAGAMRAKGFSRDAAALLNDTLRSARTGLGEASADTAACMSSLAGLLDAVGSCDEALALATESLSVSRSRDDTNQVIDTCLLLVHLHKNRGELARASELATEALCLTMSIHEGDHIQTAQCYAAAGMVAYYGGSGDEAEESLTQALRLSRRILGDRHLQTLHGAMQLVEVLLFRNKLEAATSLAAETAADAAAALGADHPDALAALHTVARVHYDAGDFEAAEAMCMTVMERRSAVLGADAFETFASAFLMALISSSACRPADADACFAHALGGFRAKLGDSHPRTAGLMGEYGRFLTQQPGADRLPEAAALLQGQLAALRRSGSYGDAQFAEARSLQALSDVFLRMGRTAEAERCMREALALQSSLHGDGSETCALTKIKLVQLLCGGSGIDEAARLCNEALDACESSFDSAANTKMLIATACAHTGRVLASKGAFDTAIPLFRRVLAARRSVSGDADATVVQSVYDLARVLDQQGEDAGVAAAAPLYREALAGYRRLNGPAHSRTLACQHSLARVLVALSVLDEAEALLADELAARRRAAPLSSPDILPCMRLLTVVLAGNGSASKAAALLSELLAEMRPALGDTHPNVVQLSAVLASVATVYSCATAEAESAVPEGPIRGGSGPGATE